MCNHKHIEWRLSNMHMAIVHNRDCLEAFWPILDILGAVLEAQAACGQPREPKRHPRELKRAREAVERVQEAAKRAQEARKKGQETPRTIQEAPKRLGGCGVEPSCDHLGTVLAALGALFGCSCPLLCRSGSPLCRSWLLLAALGGSGLGTLSFTVVWGLGSCETIGFTMVWSSPDGK